MPAVILVSGATSYPSLDLTLPVLTDRASPQRRMKTTMTITFAGREPTGGYLVRTAIRSIATCFAAYRANRAALASLLEMDAHRLDDLGITVAEIY